MARFKKYTPPAKKQFSGAESHKSKTPPAKPRFSGTESHKSKTPPAKPQYSGTESRKPNTPPAKPKFYAAERSALYARREAANVLRTVLRGDAERRAVASIKSLVFSPSVRNKRGTFALVCETLKHLNVIKDVLEIANVLNSKWKKQEPLVYIICYDILFGKDTPSIGDAEKFLMRRKDALLSSLATLLVRKKVESVDQLIGLSQPNGDFKPRYVRVNTLKIDVDSAVKELEKHYTVKKDETVPDLLVLPPGSDLHAHPLLTNGRIFLQGKASSMAAAALQPEAGWEVLDACSAPGNKTVHLAALMEGQGKIIACELNEERVKRLEHTIKLSGATNIEVCHGDFLGLNPKDTSFAKVRAILLDPSCSGSGTITDRLDHLLPSHSAVKLNYDSIRLHKLAVFQKKALAHALSFPQVERVVYSTCSIDQIENEDVVSSVLPLASSLGFKLATPFPQWQRRGLPVFAGSEHLFRMDPVEDKEGFFIALFVKENKLDTPKSSELPQRVCRRRHKQRSIRFHPFICPKMFRALGGI
ncbi:25S rRNA (cytosine-C(5))-methyltransferase NSUN5 [Cardamine amara subsp. amara]|uniref:25S rRNA (Cytosine-C(5))-methyltransferase NSUN5 n=1 Tax=Cardamine amara subsp. amara TaxID=228776 RepID=A0ABD1BHJ6_CARAN